MEHEQPRRVAAGDLAAFVARAFEAVNIRPEDARVIAELMVSADLQGSDGHGVFRLPQYIRCIRAGGVDVRPAIRVERELPGMALVNGDNGMGHLVMRYAAELAIAKAECSGVAWVGVNHSNHAGPASLYAAMPMARDIRGSRRLPAAEAIRLPGERSYTTRRERARLGIPLPQPLRASLDAVARELAILRLG